MTAPIAYLSMPELLGRLQTTLHLTQKELADVLGCSARTVSRFYDRGGFLLPGTYVKLAHACHPHDRELAAYLATSAGQTLEGLGLERSAAPGAPPPPAPSMPSARHMADSVVCAGAEALQMSPHAMRTALVAAFQRTVALGMSAEQVLAAMTPEKAETPAKATRGANAPP